jgi:hypothetical protein
LKIEIIQRQQGQTCLAQLERAGNHEAPVVLTGKGENSDRR